MPEATFRMSATLSKVDDIDVTTSGFQADTFKSGRVRMRASITSVTFVRVRNSLKANIKLELR